MALEMAVEERFPDGIPHDTGLILNSDNGCQFGSRKFQGAVKVFGFTFTRTAYDTPEDNAYIESFFGRLKEEEVWIKEYDTMEEAEISIDSWINFYNKDRIHSSLNYLTPVEFREEWLKKMGSNLPKESILDVSGYYNTPQFASGQAVS